MRTVLLSLAASALMAASVQAAPSLGYWEEGDPGSTHQYWDFNIGYVGGIPGGALEAIPEPPVINPDIPGVKMQIGGLVVWDPPTDTILGPLMVLDIKIPNYPERNAHKEIWVDLGFVPGIPPGDVISASVVAGGGQYGYETLQAQGDADFGFRIYPNPEWENIQFVILGATAPAILDYVHVDTICIPAPGAILLASVGAGLVGWLRRRRAL